MEEPKKYELIYPLNIKGLLDAGFRGNQDVFKIKKPLYKYDNNTSQTYVYLDLVIDRDWMIENVVCDDGATYAAFYNPTNNNDVCQKIVARYNSFMDELVKKKILKRRRNVRKNKN